METYIGYQLHIDSHLALPGFLACSEGTPDVIVRLNPEIGRCEQHEPGWHYDVATGHARMTHRYVGDIVVRDGREIIITRYDSTDEQLLPLYVAGSALAYLLIQRGLLVLHASAVAIDGQVVAFLGDSGDGKSSTTAALHGRGHGIVADDVVPVDLCGTFPTASAGAAQIKVNREVATALGFAPERLITLHPRLDEYAYRERERFSHAALPIRALFTLADGERHSIERLSEREAALNLMRYSFGAEHMQQAVRPAAHFLECAQLARSVPVYRLTRQRSLAVLPNLAEFVERALLRELL